MIRLSALRGLKVRSLDGEILGRVHEVHCKDCKVSFLMCGAGSLIERWTGRSKGRRIAWESVRRIGRDGVIVAPSRSAKGR